MNAKIVQMYSKGEKADLRNYCTIKLFLTIYKMEDALYISATPTKRTGGIQLRKRHPDSQIKSIKLPFLLRH